MSKPPSELVDTARAYCSAHGCDFVSDSTFRFGDHGSVFACVRASSLASHALKIHERETPYFRDRDVYLRFRDLGIESVQGHHVPQLIDYDDEIMEQWERDKEEQFEENWPKASSILSTLRNYGIYVADVNPGNIGF